MHVFRNLKMKRKNSESENKKRKVAKVSLETVELKEETSSDDDDGVSSEDEKLAAEDATDEITIETKDDKNNERLRKEHITTPYLTKFEIAGVIGVRAWHIAMGAPVAIETHGETNPKEIAKMELRAKKINLDIRRLLPNGTYEQHRVKDLIYTDNY